MRTSVAVRGSKPSMALDMGVPVQRKEALACHARGALQTQAPAAGCVSGVSLAIAT
ncbi:hypothetical protein KAM426_27270 [Aquipseudomonas alcaligenes]|nr:hypothetical protein KAM426_27270 [Pseudomonas alcaligenes]